MCPITTRRWGVDCIEFAELEGGGSAYVAILARNNHPYPHEASPRASHAEIPAARAESEPLDPRGSCVGVGFHNVCQACPQEQDL